MKNKNTMYGLGASLIDEKSYIFMCSERDMAHGTFTVRESEDGMTFKTLTSNAKVVNINGPTDDFRKCSFFHISKDGKKYYLTYKVCDKKQLCVARSTNLIDWERLYILDQCEGSGKIVSEYLYAGRNVMYTGGDSLRAYVSSDLVKWSRVKKDLVTIDKSRKNDEIVVLDVQVVDDGVFVIYAVVETDNEISQYKLYGLLFDYGDPTKVLWKSEYPIYETKNTKINYSAIFGTVLFDEYFVSYWMNEKDEIFLIRHFFEHEKKTDKKNLKEVEKGEKINDEEIIESILERVPENPIMSPQNHLPWEAKATYNPTAIEYDGTIHIIYRADGDDLMSVWGYASTIDGVSLENRSVNCIYQRKIEPAKIQFPSPVSYTSGNNGNGGCEDPRAVLIDGMVYVTFTAFDGWGSVRVALTSINFEDFKNRRWHWNKTTLISPPGEMNKNWVIFPEKINGKFAIFHSFYPEILIDYFDSLDELDGTTFINSNNTRPIDHSRGWDSWFRGVGPAPLKTDDGWLVFYHAMDHKDPDRYLLGALLLDLEDPTKVLYRSRSPILKPEEYYENEGHKWGVIYSCGAVIKDEQIFVYYGGADKFVCVATAPLQQFLDDLKNTEEVKMMIN